jgi:hypothetical protein
MNKTILLLFCIASIARSQTSTPPPKKNPFEGWGSSLDQKPGGPSTHSPLASPSLGKSTPLPPLAPGAKPPAGGGLALGPKLDSALDYGVGGHSREIEDVVALLSKYGQANDDEGPHPEVQVYPGIPYLAPLELAERVLIQGSTGIKSYTNVGCGGFPPGLVAVGYDGTWFGRFNHLYIVKDRANQVVSLEFTGGTERDRDPFAGTKLNSIPGDWRVYDFVNDRVRGTSKADIRNYIDDYRKTNHFIIVDTFSRSPASQVTSWYMPQPMINLMLYFASQRPK